ncbi:nitroreductase family protein [Draconibacterium sp. IB214405]|uniref:nitroreductase family protein n=1 Tax=Draconibacterium sp. IB214405 TaxID=3097352 RepID=UPI002A144ABE|nr:nitroreductase family protein [Draconibacterium sp. IB214405]MDX8339177.1 nitroreductase family protein [Draconibacterium sp. IB214405]
MNRRHSLMAGAALVTGLTLIPVVKSAGENLASQTEDSFWEVIKKRRSVRAYKSDPVPMADLEKIVDAARMAPTAGNQQPWKFLVITDKKKIEALKAAKLSEAETYLKEEKKLDGEELKAQLQDYDNQLTNGYLSAPAYIVVLTDNSSRYPEYNHWDGPLAAANLMLAARALGYGTVHITDSFSEELTRKVFNIPENYTRVCFTPVGVPLEWPVKEKLALGEFVVSNSF